MELLTELCSLISSHGRGAGRVTPLPGVRLVTTRQPTEPINAVYEPAFAIVAQGMKRTVLGDRIYEYGAGQYLVVSVDLPITGHVVQASDDEPYLALLLTLRPTEIATLLLETAISERSDMAPRGMAVCDASSELLDPIVRLARLFDQPVDAAVLAPMLEREILWRLLNGEQGATVRQIGLADSRLSQIGRAIRWIRTHYAEILRIEDLADAAGMSASTFYRNFRAVTSMSPVQYQKQIRLLEARAKLIAKTQDIAAVGFDVGYDSPSQFSREYRRFFGAPPGKDAARLRDGAFAEDILA